LDQAAPSFDPGPERLAGVAPSKQRCRAGECERTNSTESDTTFENAGILNTEAKWILIA